MYKKVLSCVCFFTLAIANCEEKATSAATTSCCANIPSSGFVTVNINGNVSYASPGASITVSDSLGNSTTFQNGFPDGSTVIVAGNNVTVATPGTPLVTATIGSPFPTDHSSEAPGGTTSLSVSPSTILSDSAAIAKSTAVIAVGGNLDTTNPVKGTIGVAKTMNKKWILNINVFNIKFLVITNV